MALQATGHVDQYQRKCETETICMFRYHWHLHGSFLRVARSKTRNSRNGRAEIASGGVQAAAVKPLGTVQNSRPPGKIYITSTVKQSLPSSW